MTTAFATVEEAFRYCRDMDASLSERLETFANVAGRCGRRCRRRSTGWSSGSRRTMPGETAPKPGELMPSFTLPDETGRLVSLDALLASGPVAVHLPSRPLVSLLPHQHASAVGGAGTDRAEGAQIVAIMPDREQFAASFKSDAGLHYPVLTDIDNGYALSLNLAIWVGAELEQLMAAAGRDLPRYQGNEGWFLPIPATFVLARDGTITARFIDPTDYRRRMTVEDLLAALQSARNQEKSDQRSRSGRMRSRLSRGAPDGMKGPGKTWDSRAVSDFDRRVAAAA